MEHVLAHRPGRQLHGRMAALQLHLKEEAAHADQVAVLQDGVADALAVDERSIQAVQVEYLPQPVEESEAAVPAADIGERQADVGLAMPAEDSFRLGQFNTGAARLQ